MPKRAKADLTKAKVRSAIKNGSRILSAVDHRSLQMRRLRDLLSDHVSDLGGPDLITHSEKLLASRASMIALLCEIKIKIRRTDSTRTRHLKKTTANKIIRRKAIPHLVESTRISVIETVLVEQEPTISVSSRDDGGVSNHADDTDHSADADDADHADYKSQSDYGDCSANASDDGAGCAHIRSDRKAAHCCGAHWSPALSPPVPAARKLQKSEARRKRTIRFPSRTCGPPYLLKLTLRINRKYLRCVMECDELSLCDFEL